MRSTTALGIAAVCFLYLCSSPAASPSHFTTGDERLDVQLRWKRKSLRTDRLPTTLSSSAREAIELWAPWAAEHEYRMDLERDERVLLLSRADKHKSVRAEQKLIGETLARFDEEYPWTLPEVPELADESALFAGHGAQGPEAPVVLVQFWRRDDLRSALDHMVQHDPDLAAWAQTVRDDYAVQCTAPLMSGFLEKDVDLQRRFDLEVINVWDPKCELVHGLTQGLLAARFGRVPYWLEQGISWNVEHDVLGRVHCFPHRENFENVSQHDGFDTDLKLSFKHEHAPLDLESMVTWKDGTFDEQAAAQSWGVVRWFRRAAPGELAGFVSDLAAFHRVKGVQVDVFGKPVPDADYRVPFGTQVKALERRGGEDFLSECLHSFREGRRYVPGKRRRRRS